MVERAETSLAPRAMREVAETDWNNPASVMCLEDHVRRLVALFGGMAENRDADATNRARVWTIGVLVSAYPRALRTAMRPHVTELVARVSGGTNAGPAEQATETRGKKTAKKGRTKCQPR